MQANAEISHKVRLAIKTKLTELGAYVDDELPDYVLVMVANRRGRQDMKKELELFFPSKPKSSELGSSFF